MLSYLQSQTATSRPLVGVSACLLGTPVRYDGGHKLHQGVADAVQAALTLIPVCPEAEAGLGIPRPPVHLVIGKSGARAVGRELPALDVTEALQVFTMRQIQSWQRLPLVGHIFKARSPSCGLGSTPVVDNAGSHQGNTNGLYAGGIKAALPWLVTAEEAQLDDKLLQENFIARCRLADEILHQQIDLYEAWLHYRSLLRAADDQALRQLATLQDRQGFLARFLGLMDNAELDSRLRENLGAG